MKKSLLLLIFLFHSLHAAKVVIIGAGPVGLATAIEAITQDHEVLLVEMRKEYTRKQTILLDDNSLALLEKWGVSIASSSINGKKIGMIAINELEDALKRQVFLLGVTSICGTYVTLHEKQATVVLEDGTKMNLCYDLLVGADGIKSKVREDAKITHKLFGKAFGKIAFIQVDITPVDTQPDIDEEAFTPLKAGNYFVMKIPIPQKNAVVLCMQSTTADNQSLHAILHQCNWTKEEAAIQKNESIYSDWFEIPLQQATRFYDEKYNIILVGDAAASASYLRGGGLNAGFQTAHFAGLLFKNLYEPKAYLKYNDHIQIVTDRLINESQSLYAP